jgi:tetratricopeptide (TPR) repeat protein
VLRRLVYILLCAAVLSYTAAFAGQDYTLPEQAHQFDMLTKQAQSGSVEAEIESAATAEPADETVAEEAAIEPEPEEVEEDILEPQVKAEIESATPAEPADETAAEEVAIEPELENVAGADACDEARKWYNEGVNLSDDSAQEAAYYQRAIELCPDFSAAHNRLGEVYINRGEYESAFKEFNQAKNWSLLNESGLDHRGNRSLLVDQFINQGKIYRMQGRYEMAAGQFKRALRINPDSRAAMNQLQYVNKMSGKYDNIVLPLLQSISSPIFTRTPGMTFPRGVFSAGFLFRWWRQEATLTEDMFIGGIPDMFSLALPFERNTDVLQAVLDLRYGLTKNITIGLFPRWSTIWASNMTLNTSARDKATGLGDTILMAKFQIFATRKTRISLYHLYSIPTGDEDAKAGPLRAHIPLGSGSFNFTPGIAFTTEKEYLAAPLTIHSNISYRFTNGEVIGDELRCDLAITYPFSPAVNSFMELNYRWRDTFIHPQTITIYQSGAPPGTERFQQIETTLKEKSGHALFLSPGFQFIFYKDIRLNVGVQIPLIKPKGGWAETFVINFGMRGFWDWW